MKYESSWTQPGEGFLKEYTKPVPASKVRAGGNLTPPYDLKDISKLSKMGARTIGIYIFTTVIAVSIGLGMVNLIKPGNAITAETQQDLIASYEGDASGVKANADKQRESGPLQALEDIVPDNIFAAASDNANMLQVIFFAIFFGIGLILIPEKTAESIRNHLKL